MRDAMTSDLEGAALDAAVAMVLGRRLESRSGVAWLTSPEGILLHKDWRPSTDWAIGGPLIERERISVGWQDGEWHACMLDRAGEHLPFLDADCGPRYSGPTPLIAACRAFVASRS